jgi:hypothetical protein
LYQEHHEEDFFLYIAYSDESVYGDSQREIWSCPHPFTPTTSTINWNIKIQLSSLEFPE